MFNSSPETLHWRFCSDRKDQSKADSLFGNLIFQPSTPDGVSHIVAEQSAIYGLRRCQVVTSDKGRCRSF